jgi:VCBS repeat-containing protein
VSLAAPVAQEDHGPLASSEPPAEPAPPVPEVERTPAGEAIDGNGAPPVPAVVQPGSPSPTSGSHIYTDASRRSRRRWLIAGVILLLFLLVGTIALRIVGGASPLPTIFPSAASSASVSIIPDRNDLKNTYTILGVTRAPNAAQREVQARLMSSATPSQSMTVKATGNGTIPAVQAQGILTFYNALPYAQTIAVGTVLTDANGIQVVNDQSAVIPAAQPPAEGSAIASAHVVTAGASGNIPAMDFNTVACCFSGVTVANTTAFHGGQDPLKYSFVQQSDIDAAANSLKTALTPSAQKALQAQALPNEQLITPARCASGVVSDHAAGDKAASVTVTVTVTCVSEAYDRQGVQALAASLLRTDETKTLGVGYMLMSNIVTMVTKTAVIDTQGTISILVNAEGVWVYQFTDAQKGDLARLIAGKSNDDAQALLLQQKGVGKVNISVSGGTDNTLPTDPHHITIVVQSLPGLR